MNWDIIKGNWGQMKGKVREKWGELTDDEYDQIAGRKDQFVGKLQEKYGYTREEAEKHSDEFFRNHEMPGNGVPGVQTGGQATDGTPDTRGIMEKIADAVTGDPIDDKTGKVVR